LLGGSEVARGRAGVLEGACLEGDVLQLGPAEQVSIIDPLGNHSNGAHDAAVIGINLVGGRCHIIGAARAHAFNGGDYALLLFVAKALDGAINFFGSGYSAARRIHVDDDRLDGIILAEFLELGNDRARIKNNSFEVHDADLVTEAMKRGAFPAGMEHKVDQREDCQYEKEESSASDHDPKQRAGALLVSHDGLCSLAP